MTKKQSCKLNFGQKYKVIEWLKCNEEWLKSDKPLMTEVARRLTQEMKFPLLGGEEGEYIVITDKALYAMCDEVGLKWERRILTGGNVSKNLRQELADLRKEATELRKEVTDLRKGLGEAQDMVLRDAHLMDEMQKRDRQQQAEIDSLRGLVHHLFLKTGTKTPPGYILPVVEQSSVIKAG